MSDRIFGLDLGTSSIKIYKKSKGIIVDEKNIMSIEKKKKSVIAFGDEAYEMFEKAPENIHVTFPMLNGVIAEFDNMQKLLHLFFTNKELGRAVAGSKECYIAVPTDITDVEKRAFYDLIAGANVKAKKIHIVEKPIADALGADLDVTEAQGIMMVNIGADTTEISIISLGGIVLSKLIKVGGNKLDESICLYVKKNYNLIIGAKTARAIKMELAYALPGDDVTMNVMGRDIITGLPLELAISSSMVYEAIREYLFAIVDAIKVILERTPPELSSDIIDAGIFVSGGSAMIKKLDELIAQETDLRVNIVEEPADSVINGLGKIIETPEFQSLAYPIKQPTYN